MENYERLTVTEIAFRVRKGTLSATELCTEALNRAAADEYNAFQQLCKDSALQAAADIDALPLARRESLPLAGVPMVIKAENDIKGIPTTFGGRSQRTPAAHDSEVVRRLRDAGAVIIGVTNMPEFGQFPFSESARYGMVKNPRAPKRTPGGSSGGTASAVASGIVPAGIGGDGGGSIQIPAAACGLVGLKPMRGRVSTAPNAALWGKLGTIGPLTRTVEDSALIYAVISGTTSKDRWHAPQLSRSLQAAVNEPKKPLRIGWTDQSALGSAKVQPEVIAATRNFVNRLKTLGHQVTHIGRFPSASPFFEVQFFAALAEEVDSVEFPDRVERRSEQTAKVGRRIPAKILRAAQNNKLADRLAERYKNFDLIISPTLACVLPLLGQLDGVGSLSALLRSMPMIAFTALANVTGMPAISIPAGSAPDGTPIGIQVSTFHGDEADLLSFTASLGF
ncbi:amidase family protein [Arcanobacterium hippocoleae]